MTAPRQRRAAARLATVVLVAIVGTAARAADVPIRHYDVFYDVRLVPSEGGARVSIHISGEAALVHAIRLRIDPERHTQFSGDGDVERDEHTVTWRPPKAGGALHYAFRIDHLRNQRSYDARLAEHWALFRGDDLVPPAHVVTEDGARSRSRLRIRVPNRWSVAVPYGRDRDGRFVVEHPHRRFDRPTGWMLVGRLGVLRETVAGVRVAVAGPTKQGLRRQDLLAFLRWTLPKLVKVFPEFPERLLIVGADDPMWRGGLSGPNSVYVHAERPLITPDGTSPLLHELVHTATGLRGANGGDWIVEGLAELYGLEVLRRSHTISHHRYERTLERLAERGREAKRLGGRRAHGAVTARAVGVLHALDQEIRRATDDQGSLDDVVRQLAEARGAVTPERLSKIAEAVAGRSLTRLPR